VASGTQNNKKKKDMLIPYRMNPSPLNCQVFPNSPIFLNVTIHEALFLMTTKLSINTFKNLTQIS